MCLLLSPKETLAFGPDPPTCLAFSFYRINAELTLSETLCKSVDTGSGDFVKEGGGRDVRASLFSSGVIQLSLRRRNKKMGSCNGIEQSFKQVWVSGYLCWCETTKLNSVQLNLPLWALKLTLFQSRQRGKINSSCIDISIQYNASKWNQSSRLKKKAFIKKMCQNQTTIVRSLSGVLPPGKSEYWSIQMFTHLKTGLFEWRKASSINFNKFIAAVFLSFAFSQLHVSRFK